MDRALPPCFDDGCPLRPHCVEAARANPSTVLHSDKPLASGREAGERHEEAAARRVIITPVNYCSRCGAPVSKQIPPGDDRERFVCTACATIHYQNPKIVTCCVPVVEDRVLLCRRAIEPRRGLWTLPGGFLETGETVFDGAARETWEEARARVDGDGLYTIFNLPHISQIYMFFRARVVGGQYGIGDETLETRLFREPEIPWNELAFGVISKTLEHYFHDCRRGTFPVRVEDIIVPDAIGTRSMRTG